MIDIKELTVGSYLIADDGEIYPVFAINAINNTVILGGTQQRKGWQKLELFSPIKLTNKLLTVDNCFKYISGGVGWDMYRRNDITYSVYPTNDENIILCYNYGGKYIKIKYLHQLQNFHSFFMVRYE